MVNKKNTNDEVKNTIIKKFSAPSMLKIGVFKLSCEGNIVACLWKNPLMFFDYDKINLNNFGENYWRVMYEIGRNIITVEHKQDLSPLTVETYLRKHLKLKDVYNNEGGYSTIEDAKDKVNVDNIDGYIQELYKWNSIIKIMAKGYIVTEEDISNYADKTIEEIYNDFEININNIFVNSDINIKTYDCMYNIDEHIKKWDKGLEKGLSLINLPLISNSIGGFYKGGIHLIGGISNSGKSTLTRIAYVTSVLLKNEKIVIFLNEEGLEKFQKEMLIWCINNTDIIVKNPSLAIDKTQLRDGSYSDKIKEAIEEGKKKLIELTSNHNITVVPLENYSTSIVLKMVRKYSSMGVNYFLIDTFKMDNDTNERINDNVRLQMVQNMTRIYNLVKESNKNVCMVCTIQLSKANSKTRYLSLDSISESKNIIDVCSSAVFIRPIFEDEYKSVKYYTLVGKNHNSELSHILDEDKKYLIAFITKSREGEAGMGSNQIIIEIDFARNTYKELGYTKIALD